MSDVAPEVEPDDTAIDHDGGGREPTDLADEGRVYDEDEDDDE